MAVNDAHLIGLREAKMKVKLFSLLLIAWLFSSLSAYGDDGFNASVLISGNWGTKEGEFGIEKEGKTELGYALDFVVSKEGIYILDSMNNRVQLFDMTGKFVKQIKLNTLWQQTGLPWDFSILNGNLYILIGKPPYYSPIGIKEINKYSHEGTRLKSFGSNKVPKNKEEYFDSIFSDIHHGLIYCGLGSIKALAFNSEGDFDKELLVANKNQLIDLVGISQDGKPLMTISNPGGINKRTVVINPISKAIEKEVKGYFSLLNSNGRFINIHTMRGKKRKNTIMTTSIEVLDSITNNTSKFELKGDIKVVTNGNDKIYRYSGNFIERSKMDADGNIYHMIALNDGVVLRKITLK